MTKLAKKFYVGKPILHCLTQNIGLIAFSHIKILRHNFKNTMKQKS